MKISFMTVLLLTLLPAPACCSDKIEFQWQTLEVSAASTKGKKPLGAKDRARVLKLRGDLFLGKGQTDEAISQYLEATKHSDNAQVELALAEAYFKKGRNSKVANALNSSFNLASSEQEFNRLLTKTKTYCSQKPEVQRHLSFGLKTYLSAKTLEAERGEQTRREPTDIERWLHIGKSYKAIKDYGNAIQAFKQVLKFDPGIEKAKIEIGSCQNELKKLDPAKK